MSNKRQSTDIGEERRLPHVDMFGNDLRETDSFGTPRRKPYVLARGYEAAESLAVDKVIDELEKTSSDE
ncbi:MAG TPA: hypothetical protein VJU84_08835 [Pyrinomonadaceae bacterium]|nr:hypothetical protein [Pyrinomonadaceae bacterium]